jgi:hypothetical protein
MRFVLYLQFSEHRFIKKFELKKINGLLDQFISEDCKPEEKIE